MKIKDFEEKLGISRIGAILRLLAALIAAICFIGLVIIAVVNFPYKKNYSLEFVIPEGNYQLVKDVSGLNVGLDEDQFFNSSFSDKILVFSKECQNVVTFSSIKDEIIFYYDKKLETKKNSDFYKIKKIEIRENALIVEKKRDFCSVFVVSIVWLIAAIVIIILFFRSLI